MPGVFTDLIAGTADGSARQIRCRCDRTCHCPAGAPCRCQSACRCGTALPSTGPQPVRTDLWTEAGEAELGARRGRAPTTRPAAPRRPATQPPRPPLQRRPAPPLQAQRQRQVEQARQRRRLQRLNQYFAWRFGWGRQLARIGQQLGCGPCLPGSLAFLTAMARWQRRHGLRVTGVLTPTLATWLLGRAHDPDPEPGLPTDADPTLSAAADGPDMNPDANPYGNPDGTEDPTGADGPADADADEFTFFGRPACGCR